MRKELEFIFTGNGDVVMKMEADDNCGVHLWRWDCDERSWRYIDALQPHIVNFIAATREHSEVTRQYTIDAEAERIAERDAKFRAERVIRDTPPVIGSHSE